MVNNNPTVIIFYITIKRKHYDILTLLLTSLSILFIRVIKLISNLRNKIRIKLILFIMHQSEAKQYASLEYPTLR